MSIVITEPGVYDIPEADYHADPVPQGSLSASGMKKLLRDGGPAIFHYEEEHPEPPSEAMELGTAAHKLVLGSGPKLVEVFGDDWRTKAAKELAAEVRASGGVPLLSKDMRTVEGMAAALREHPLASALLSPERGRTEMSAFWLDEEWGVGIWRRCRFDLMPHPHLKPVIADYKSCASASRRDFPKSVDNFGYHVQAAQYIDGYEVIYGDRLREAPSFVFIAQEKKPPYLVATYQLDAEAIQIGRDACYRAMEIWHDCRKSGIWPGYSQEIETISLPRWSTYREDFYA